MKPLTLLYGGDLLALLEKHGHKARVDLKEARLLQSDRWSLWSSCGVWSGYIALSETSGVGCQGYYHVFAVTMIRRMDHEPIYRATSASHQ